MKIDVDARTTLSVLMPVHNEARTVAEALRRVLDAPLPVAREVIIIDDGSTDATPALLAAVSDPRVRVLTLPVNRGKGAALRTGLAASRGDWVIFHDADLEYAPEDWPALLAAAATRRADAVYGSRFAAASPAMRPLQHAGNRLLTRLTNALYRARLSDMETCSKLIVGDLARALHLSADRFDIEPEITAKLLRAGVRIDEVPISYAARTHAEGKQIGWRDGVAALAALVRHRFSPVFTGAPAPRRGLRRAS